MGCAAASACVGRRRVKSCAEGLDLREAGRRAPTPVRGRVVRETDARSPRPPRPDRPRDEPATAVRADVAQDAIHAAGAERALVAADARVGRVGGQVRAAELAVGAKFEQRRLDSAVRGSGHLRRVSRSTADSASDLIVAFRYDQAMVRSAPASSPHRVAALVYDGLSPFELGIAVEVFGLERPELEAPWWYRFDVCAERPGPLRTLGSFDVVATDGLELLASADTVIVPGSPDVHGDPSQELVASLRAAHARGARIVSICTGAFTLAGAGLLDGRTATTHWRYAPLLARRHPAVTVLPDGLYVDHGDIFTSAGSAAGIDLCL